MDKEILNRTEELEKKYENHSMCILHFWRFWSDVVKKSLLPSFRADRIYLSLLEGGINESHYKETYKYAKKYDHLNLLDILTDDDLFGNIGFNIDGRFITRDLLDSILEINTICKYYEWNKDSDITILDIGAGYGRFAYRLLQALPNAKIICTDAVPVSTAICEAYLDYRNADKERYKVVPLNEIENLSSKIDLAMNIHSWSECSSLAIEAWLNLIKNNDIKNIFLVPHSYTMLAQDSLYIPDICKKFGYNISYEQNKFKYEANTDKMLYPAPYLFLKSI